MDFTESTRVPIAQILQLFHCSCYIAYLSTYLDAIGQFGLYSKGISK